MDAYIVAARRTANTRAKKGGLRFTRPDDFATLVIKSLVESVPGLENSMVDDLIVGNAVQEAEQGMQMGRMIALTALGMGNAGMVINRYCGSGVKQYTLPRQDTSGNGGLHYCRWCGINVTCACYGWKTGTQLYHRKDHPEYYTSMGLTAEEIAKIQDLT